MEVEVEMEVVVGVEKGVEIRIPEDSVFYGQKLVGIGERWLSEAR